MAEHECNRLIHSGTALYINNMMNYKFIEPIFPQ